MGPKKRKRKRKLGVYFTSAPHPIYSSPFFLASCCLPPQMSLMASLSNPYIVEYKDGWVDEVQTPPVRNSIRPILIGP